MNNTRKEKRAWWANHIKAWKASGETQSGYCRQHQIAHKIFKPPDTKGLACAILWLPVPSPKASSTLTP